MRMRKKLGLLAAVLVSGLSATPAVAESASPAGEAQLVRLQGVPRGLDILQTIPLFSGTAPAPWAFHNSQNVSVSLGVAKTAYPVLRMESRQDDLLAKDRKSNWFVFSRPLKADATWAQAEGLRLVLAANPSRSWPLALYLNTSPGVRFRYYPITPGTFTPEFQDRLLPFRNFQCVDGKETLDPAKVTGLTFESSGLAGTLYLAELSLYRPKSQTDGWLSFTSRSTPTRKNGVPDRFCNIHEPGVPVSLEFSQAAPPPAGMTGFEVEIRDYDDAMVARRPVALEAGKTAYKIDFQTATPGYYEVRAYGTGPQGRRETLSCLKTTGTMPPGLGTFAVVPATLGENLAAMKAAGPDTFWGFDERADAFGLMPLMRLSWRLPYRRWSVERDGKPDRSSGLAPWAREEIAKTPPDAAWQPGIVAFSPNIDVPAWAKTPGDGAPGFQWDDYLAFLRDAVRVAVKIHPDQQPRIYDGSWEIFLNSPEHPSRKPIYTVEMVTELYRRSAAVIKQEDPAAWLIGPCDGYLHPVSQDWFHKLFQAGFLKYVDGISMHSYSEPPPEQADIPNALAMFRSEIRKYKGRDLPLFSTEAGFESRVGSVDRLRDHARWEVRYAMILKGEGVRLHLAFYQFDFGIGTTNRAETWGFCFNLDPKMSFGPKEIAPKPAVPAYAVCAKMLFTARPVQNLRWWGKDVWGYVFEDQGEPLLAVWHPYRRQPCRVPVGDVARVTVTSIMGHQSVVPAKDGFATVEIGPDPVYITGAAKELYLTDQIAATVVYPGQSRTLDLKLPGAIQAVKSWGGVTAVPAGAGLRVTVPGNLPPSPVPLQLTCRDPQGQAKTVVKWLTIDPPLELQGVQPVQKDGVLGAGVTLANHADHAAPVRVLVRTEKSSEPVEAKAVLRGGETRELFLPVQVARQAAATDAMDVNVRIEAGAGRVLERQDRFFFLCALRHPDVPDPVFSNQVHLEGPGASGKPDQADLRFTWNEQALTVTVVSHDDVFRQRQTDGTIWMEDGVQLAVDTDPNSEYPYDPYAGRLSKKLTEICAARTPRGNLVWRHTTYSRDELPVGDVTGQGIRFDWNRDEPGKTTTYVLHIPWAQLGLDKVRPGQVLGLALLINDADGDGQARRYLSLFDGIANAKNFRLYGRLVLK